MFQSLDTIIAFVTIMSIVSLLVTIVVQMLSAALSLRGKNLANALALTFQTIDPSLEERAYQLAGKILSDPLLSDSTRTKKSKGRAGNDVVKSKPWHFANPTEAMCLASAVRPEEVYAALIKLASAGSAGVQPNVTTGKVDKEAAATKAVPDFGAAAKQLLQALGTPLVDQQGVTSRLAAVAKAAESITDAPTRETILASIQNTGAALVVDAEAARAKFEAWFSSAQDRAQQWFQLHTRGLTIAASILLALILQLDAVEIFRYVSSNSAARAALVSDANRVVKEGDGVLDEKGGLVKRIADAWNANTNSGGLRIDTLSGMVHTGQLEDALEKRYDQKPVSNFKTKNDLDQAFEKLVTETTKAYYKDQAQKISDLTKGISATGFDLVPVGFWRWPSVGQPQDGWQGFANIGPHLFGISLFAALLTLGAPYWYNLLKNLTSLRPALAQLIGKEEGSSASHRDK